MCMWGARPPELVTCARACRWLTIEFGVACIPMTSFYLGDHKVRARVASQGLPTWQCVPTSAAPTSTAPVEQVLASNLVRFAFCKTDEALDLAAERLEKFSVAVGSRPPA